MVYMQFRNYKQEAYASSLAKSGGGGGGNRNVSVISTLKDRTPVPQPEPLDEAQFKWGKPSSFSWGRDSQDFREGVNVSTTWEYPDDPEGPQPEPDPDELSAYTEEWTEVSRKETVVRIDGPDGAYVDFARIDEVTFKLPNLPDGREHFVVQKFSTSGDGISPAPPGNGSGGSGAPGAVGVGADGVIRDPGGGGASF